ncbi:hypothetical protein M0R72_12695 [Candidatus Pacearchaeota archaeon]|jgi:hypothetical protein|nr:hypothetical protein [Candidatus Pacearchaeota archaeon]
MSDMKIQDWRERRELIPTFSVHPEAARISDIVNMAADLMECRHILYHLGYIDQATNDILYKSLAHVGKSETATERPPQ